MKKVKIWYHGVIVWSGTGTVSVQADTVTIVSDGKTTKILGAVVVIVED